MSAKANKKFASHRKLFLVGKDAPFSFVEAYKSLRTNLEFLSTTSNCKTILITSSVPEEGKSNVAVNLPPTNVLYWWTATCVRARFPATCIFPVARLA